MSHLKILFGRGVKKQGTINCLKFEETGTNLGGQSPTNDKLNLWYILKFYNTKSQA